MANVVINDAHLCMIAENIRSKTGETELYKPSEMAPAISRIPSVPYMTFKGSDGEKLNYNGRWDAVIGLFGNKISTKDLTNVDSMFYGSKLKKIPFSINLEVVTSKQTTQSIFWDCKQLEELPDVSGTVFNCQYFLQGCNKIKTIPDSWATDIDWSQANIATAWGSGCVRYFFYNCQSLRSIPEALLKKMYNSSNSSNANGSMFSYCHALDEIVGFRGPKATLTSNILNSFDYTNRLKRLVFDMENGSPRVQNWSNQTLDLSQYTGYTAMAVDNFCRTTGITADKEVKDAATYQALKNDADWFSADVAYSRYNHDSAVETINSLPDCSASGGANTIKFKGAAGSATDGGAINTLTEAEIAVAAAKGWTVSLV